MNLSKPTKGSGHNNGAAVDVTQVNIATGEQLIMPTKFATLLKKRIRIT